MSEAEEVVVISASEAGTRTGVKEATFYKWKYKHYFEVVEEGDKNLRARCTLCSDSAKPLSCARNTTSNFKKHLDSVHKTANLVAILPETSKRKRSEEDNGGNQAKRQATLDRRGVSSNEVRKLVMEYIIEDMLPLTTVESPAFRKLINELSLCPVQLPDRKTLSSCIEQAYDVMMKKIKETLGIAENVSTMADVWTAHQRSYLGMTVHWINDKSLKRQKAAIACVRITGRHTYDILAGKIEEVHRRFGLQGKISATVTDNGSNFVKAFTSFSVQETEHDNNDEHSIVDDDFVVQDDDVSFTDLHSVMIPDQDDDLTQVEYELPPHQRCASHTLNLVASTDVEKHLLSSSLSKSLYRSSFGKCTALWNKTRRSTLASDKMSQKLKRKLLVPSPTRWNSQYDAVSRVIENPSAVLNEFCNDIGVRSFTEKELVFLKEYCVVLEPLSKGLDILQGEDHCYYGTLLPTLYTIVKRTKAEIPNLSAATTGLAYAIESAIKRRFDDIFESKEAIIAALVSPKFKVKWVDSQENKDRYKQMMIDELRDLESVAITGDDLNAATQDEKKRDFYDFDTEDDEPTEDVVENEAAEYFRNAKSLDCLCKYPKIKQLFLKYNVTIPSSAPVERLFSLGSLVLSSKRNRLTDGKFEKILLMRYNKHFVKLV